MGLLIKRGYFLSLGGHPVTLHLAFGIRHLSAASLVLQTDRNTGPLSSVT